jgi:hypothetical protein
VPAKYCKPAREARKFPQNFVATTRKLGYLPPQFSRLFWGEQPPFTPIGRGGRYFFVEEEENGQRSRSSCESFREAASNA